MAIVDSAVYFTGVGTSGFSPTAQTTTVAPFTIDTAPLGLPTGSGGAGATGYNAGSATNAGRDLGVGGEIWMEVLVTAAFVSAGGATNTFELVTDSTATITTANVLLASTAYAIATLIAGFAWRVQLPASLVYQRYVGMADLVGTSTNSAGTVEAKLLQNIQQSDLYLSGFLVA